MGCSQRAYEVARFEAYLILLPHLDKDKNVAIADIYPFPWEKQEEKKQSPAEMKREIKKMALFFGTKPKQEKLPVTKKK